MYALLRPFLLALIWMLSVVELGLTADRLHHTNKIFGFHEKVVIALLVASILTILWVPYALLTHLGRNGAAGRSVGSGLLHEGSGGFLLWFFWLVSTAIYTNDLPAHRFCAGTDQCNIRISIQAIAWTIFGLLTLYKVMLAMHAAAYGLIGRGGVSPGAANAYGDKTVGTGPAVNQRV